MKIKQYQVDAFTPRPFEGNPAAVCPLAHWLDDALLQAIAQENNLSETAFFVPAANGFHLRWFTPASEVDLCGAIVTAPGIAFDFVSRFFAPRPGIPEDPVTGSAHCALAPYWVARLGKRTLSARQLSARGGNVACELKGDRVLLSGAAVTFMEAEITL